MYRALRAVKDFVLGIASGGTRRVAKQFEREVRYERRDEERGKRPS